MNATRTPISRPAVIAGSVVVLHLAGLYALQTGLLQRAVELVVPVEMISEFIKAPEPVAPPPSPQPEIKAQKKPEPLPVQKQVPTPQPKQTPPPAPQPVAINDTTPSPSAATGANTPQPPAPPIAAPVAAAPELASSPAPAAPALAKIELPRSDANYLRNPPPAYPRISKNFGEQGRVLVRVWVNADGSPDASRIEVRSSSGFERLDAAALTAVKGWRFVPGTRGGVPEGMWVNVPVNFTLD
jgi:periplasmic protein TonB